jgi:hypothetical protein
MKEEHDAEKVKGIIPDICATRAFKAIEIATYLNKGVNYVKRKYLSDMIAERQLKYLHPEMINPCRPARNAKQPWRLT